MSRLLGRQVLVSTIFQLLLRFYDPHLGGFVLTVSTSILLILGHQIRIAMVPQDCVIFGDSVAENIHLVIKRDRYSDNEDGYGLASAHAFISKLPEGTTPIWERRESTIRRSETASSYCSSVAYQPFVAR